MEVIFEFSKIYTRQKRLLFLLPQFPWVDEENIGAGERLTERRFLGSKRDKFHFWRRFPSRKLMTFLWREHSLGEGGRNRVCWAVEKKKAAKVVGYSPPHRRLLHLVILSFMPGNTLLAPHFMLHQLPSKQFIVTDCGIPPRIHLIFFIFPHMNLGRAVGFWREKVGGLRIGDKLIKILQHLC